MSTVIPDNPFLPHLEPPKLAPPSVTKTVPLTAVKKLELSQLDQKKIQRELMGDDLDLDKLNVYLKSKVLFDSTSHVIDINVERTIDGASTLDLVVNDYDRSLLRSGALNARLDINIDGLWFRLVKVSRSAGEDNLTLGFEQREIAILRTYPKPGTIHDGVKFANRDHTTRAEFILNLIREVKEFKIPVVMPHLHQVQQIEKKNDVGFDWGNVGGNNAINGSSGIPPLSSNFGIQASADGVTVKGGLTVKGVAMTKEQRANANTILQVGQNMGARRKVLVAAIATATVESVLRNLDNAHSDGTSVGLFQQTDNNGYGSREERADPATAARMFFNRCIAKDKEEPHVPTGQLCQDVQGSNFPNAYATRVEEASRTVAAFGVPQNKGDDSTEGSAADANNMAATSNWSPGGDNAYYYYRGIPPKNGSGNQWKREDNWTCIRRLADEVDWRAFFISGTFYYLTDDDLYKMQPSATITESTKGVLGIGFDYDLGKKGATVDIPAMVGLWLAPPGAIIVLQQMGPLDGRWLVNSFSRSLFSSNADINLAKPTPKLPEPADANVQQNDMPTWQSGQDTTAWAPTQNGPLLQDGSRNAIVGAASRALQIENAGSHYHYEQSRPYPQSLFSQAAHDKIDCSAFATLVFKEAGLPDPNGSNYDGNGNTSSLIAHGVPVSSPAPGDLIFYREPASYPGHVGVYVGGGDIIEIGGPDGIKRMSWQYGDPVVGIRRYANR